MPEVLLTLAQRVSVHLLDPGKDVAYDCRNDVQDPDANRVPREDPEGEGGLLAGLEGRRHDQDLTSFHHQPQTDLKCYDGGQNSFSGGM